ncbi:4-hydroxy-3-methylbut-2-enyl diphosphate reductase [Micromonospora pattaloongensis]|nr:4-hydroxy-3-methylbut-2-enyl diphosphate reductase [Micromonospora pattaloongensis]
MTEEWVLLAPRRAEARTLRRGLPVGAPLRRAGVGPARATHAAARHRGAAVLAVAGVAVGLSPALRPGDLVVATEVRLDGVPTDTVACPAAPLIAAELRRRGLKVHIGPIVTVGRPADGPTRDRLAATGALAVDTESAVLLAAARRPVACVRVIGHPRPRSALTRLAAFPVPPPLRAVGPALAEWAAACTVRQVLLATPRSFCAGVERAIAVLDRTLAGADNAVYVHRPIAHDGHLLADLRRRGAVFVDDPAEIPDGAPTVFAAHGVPPAVRADALRRGLPVVDATCPLVARLHDEARRAAGRGDTVLLVGHAGHAETEGILGQDPDRITVVESAQDAERVEVTDPEGVSYLLQTTLALDDVRDVVAVLRRRFPALTGPAPDQVCYAATHRRAALRAVAAHADVVLVFGSADSSDSRRLVEVALRGGTPAYLVEDVGAVELRWLSGVRTVGMTAGVSAPPRLVDEAVVALSGLGARVREVGGAVTDRPSTARPDPADPPRISA